MFMEKQVKLLTGTDLDYVKVLWRSLKGIKSNDISEESYYYDTLSYSFDVPNHVSRSASEIEKTDNKILKWIT